MNINYNLKKVILVDEQLIKWKTIALKIQSIDELKTITQIRLINSSKNQIEI
jgi:hypothetical protein